MLRLSGEYPPKNTIKWFPSLFLLLTADIFLMGLVQTLLGTAASHWASLKRPQQIAAQGREE